jgi:hypothetical protein
MPKPSPGHEPDPMAGIVDRLLAQLPGLQSQPEASRNPIPRQATPLGAPAVVVRVHSTPQAQVIAAWLRVLLGLTLGVMMAGWPYSRTCGLPLFGYLGAVLTVILAGWWAAIASWRHRAALAHVVSLIVVFYGIMLAAAELLPRTGYAVDRATWQCNDAASTPTWTASTTQSVRISI